MKIAIEAHRIFRENKHGMDFVVLEMLRCLQKLDKVNEYYVLTAGGPDICLEETSNFHILNISAPGYALWEQVALPMAVRKIRPDLLHCTSNTAPLCPGCRKLVITLHDVIFLEKASGQNPSLYQRLGRVYRRLVVPRVVKKSTAIVTVSNYEKQRIVEIAGIPADKIYTVYNGYSLNFKQKSAGQEYLFFLGNTDPKKNTAGTLAAYAIYLQKSQKKLPLWIADLSEENVRNIAAEIGHEEILDHIKCLGYVRNTDLPDIYNKCMAFLYTSLRESFGIPSLEAMACGAPVVASNTSAIPEILGDGALLVNPRDPAEIASALLSLETDASFRKKVSDYGLQRVKNYSWENTARAYLDLYTKIGNSL
ncbi:MAG: glycosyltransferase family 4 protein [Bacteroidales bacterium]|nr:glycosyltransferase family 4 protein [Bacteroidales bacterium]